MGLGIAVADRNVWLSLSLQRLFGYRKGIEGIGIPIPQKKLSFYEKRMFKV